MQYKLLGNSGLRVSEICLGTMTFGEDWGWGASKEESRAQYDAFREAGGNFVDTANRYTEGTSETYCGEFIAPERDSIVLATKYTLHTTKGDPNDGGNHRKNMMRSVEGSLKRLNTDYIDLLYLHVWDDTTPVDEVMRGLDDLVRSGKVLYIGISDTPAWIVSRANTIAELRGWSRFVGLQIEYSLMQRTVESDLLPMAEALGLGVLAWAPLAGGALTGKYLKEGAEGRLVADSPRRSEQANKIAQCVVDIAGEIGCSPAAVAMNWVRSRSNSFPIVGARRVDQIKDSLDCMNHELGAEHLGRLDEVSAVEHGFPHNFLKRKDIPGVIFGGWEKSIDRSPTRGF